MRLFYFKVSMVGIVLGMRKGMGEIEKFEKSILYFSLFQDPSMFDHKILQVISNSNNKVRF